MSGNYRFPTNGSGSVLNNNTTTTNNNTRQLLYPGAFRNYPWGRNNTYLADPIVPGLARGEPEAPSLSLGERVVWLRDSGPEIGTARWIGRLPLVSPDWSVGVEFDRAIGTGDGKFGTKQYFKTTPNHAFFLPIMTLMKAEEYDGEKTFDGRRSLSREKETHFLPPKNKNQWEKSSCPPEERCNTHAFHDREHCCNHRKYPTAGPGNCYHEPGTCCAATEGPQKSGPPGGARCFVTSTPRNATRHKSVTIKETVGNVPGFGEWSDEDELSKFPFKSWKSSSRQSVVSCPASVGPQHILIAKELTSDSSDSDGRGGKFKTLMACFLPGQAYRDKKKRKRRKYVLASEKNKISYVSGPEGHQPEKNAVLGAVSGGGDLWRSPRGNVVTSSCSAFPPSSHQHCQSCSHVASPSPPSVVPPPRKNFSCSGLEKLNAGSCRACEYPPSASATPITPLKKKTQAPSPPVNYHHRPVSPKRFDQSALIKNEVKPAASQSSINSATTTRTPRQPVIRSLDAARNEIDISKIATKYTFVGNNGSRNNSVTTLPRKTEDSPKPEVKVLKPLNNDPLTISPHPRRTPKKKAPQPPCSSGSELSLARMDEQAGDELKKDPSVKKRMAPLPPALPRKTQAHDTMTLFGYTPREGLSRASSGATLEINLDKSLASEGSANDLLSMMGDELFHETTPEKLLKQLEEEIPALQRNLASSSSKKYPDDDSKSVKILNTDIQTMDKVKRADTKATKELPSKKELNSASSSKKDENVASSSKISLNIKPTKEEKVKKTKENKDDKKALLVASSSKKDVPAPSSPKKDLEVVAVTSSKKKEAPPSSSKKKEFASSPSKKDVPGPSTSKLTLNIVENKPEVKPAMKSSASQTNLSKEEEPAAAVAKPKKSKLKLLGGSKKSKKEEGSKDEVTEILTEIEQVVKSKPTVHDFVAAFTKFTEKAEQIAKNHQSAGPAPVAPAPVAPEPKPIKKVSPPKVKLVPLPVVVPILKEEKKSLKSFPTKWTFNFKSKDRKPIPDTSSTDQTGSLTRNESSPCLESRSETVKTVVPQASVPLSRKTYTNTAPVGPTDFRVAVDPPTIAKDDSQNSPFGPFIQNREALRRLSKETRNRHGSTLSLGRYASGERNKMAALEEDPSFNRKSFTPNASPIMARHRNAICAGKPPLPVKMVHDTLAEQSGSSANLFSQLEAAIANGQHQKAAVLARELALQKVNGSLGRLKNKTEDKFTTVSLYIEDKNSHQGPIPITIYPKMTVAMLKQKVEKEFHFKPECQRWILGKTFVVHDDSTMVNLDVCTPGCPVFLYIVAPSTESRKAEQAMASESEEEEEHEPVKVVPEEKKTIAEMPLSQQQIESYEALTEIVNRMTAVTKNMLMAEELQRSLAAVTTQEVDAPLETLEEENVEYHLAEQVADEVNSEPEVSEESEAPIVDVESDVTEEEDVEEEEEEENGIEDDSDDNNEVFEDAKQQNYQELVQLEERDLIANVEVFECPVCFVDIEVGEGTILRDCLHNFCKDCLSKAVEYSDDAVIKCPFRNHEYSCDSHLLEREIKALVTPEMFEKHLQRSMVAAESKAANSFHCKSPDCPGWCLYEDNVNVFHCPVCSLENCLTCQAIHAGKNCKQYQDEIEYEAADSEDAKKTKEYLDNMVKEGQAMHCPSCRVIVMKKWGCDWLKCSVCKTEICWVTKGHRWGPAGRGDTSAGCKCGVNGVRCHNLCNYCH